MLAVCIRCGNPFERGPKGRRVCDPCRASRAKELRCSTEERVAEAGPLLFRRDDCVLYRGCLNTVARSKVRSVGVCPAECSRYVASDFETRYNEAKTREVLNVND